jgi:ADP-ribosylglycohydrolase
LLFILIIQYVDGRKIRRIGRASGQSAPGAVLEQGASDMLDVRRRFELAFAETLRLDAEDAGSTQSLDLGFELMRTLGAQEELVQDSDELGMQASTLQSRLQGAVVGALVADSFVLSTHYQYDVEAIHQGFGRAPEDLVGAYDGYGDPRNVAQWHPGKGAGDQTDYGDSLLHALDYCARAHANPTLLQTPAEAQGETACTVTTGGQRYFSFEGFATDWEAWATNYSGYKCEATKHTLANIQFGLRAGDAASFANDLIPATRLAPLLLVCMDEGEYVRACTEATSVTHEHPHTIVATTFLAHLLFRVVHAPAALSRPALVKLIEELALECPNMQLRAMVQHVVDEAKWEAESNGTKLQLHTTNERGSKLDTDNVPLMSSMGQLGPMGADLSALAKLFGGEQGSWRERDEDVHAYGALDTIRVAAAALGDALATIRSSDAFGAVSCCCYLLARYTSLKSIVQANALLGGDSACRAVVLGMVMGGVLGDKGIPAEWRQQLCAHDEATTSVEALLRQHDGEEGNTVSTGACFEALLRARNEVQLVSGVAVQVEGGEVSEGGGVSEGGEVSEGVVVVSEVGWGGLPVGSAEGMGSAEGVGMWMSTRMGHAMDPRLSGDRTFVDLSTNGVRIRSMVRRGTGEAGEAGGEVDEVAAVAAVEQTKAKAEELDLEAAVEREFELEHGSISRGALEKARAKYEEEHGTTRQAELDGAKQYQSMLEAGAGAGTYAYSVEILLELEGAEGGAKDVMSALGRFYCFDFGKGMIPISRSFESGGHFVLSSEPPGVPRYAFRFEVVSDEPLTRLVGGMAFRDKNGGNFIAKLGKLNPHRVYCEGGNPDAAEALAGESVAFDDMSQEEQQLALAIWEEALGDNVAEMGTLDLRTLVNSSRF